jgi:hypothetical protein
LCGGVHQWTIKKFGLFLPMEVFVSEQLKNKFLFLELFANKK